MKRILKLSIPIFVAIMILFSFSAFTMTVVHPGKSVGYYPSVLAGPSPFAGMTMKEFLTLTPKKYQLLTGKKLSLPGKFSLKLAQYRVKKMVKKNKQRDMMMIMKDVETNDFDIFGFILGIALGPLGILIAYLIEGKSSSMFRWSLIGSIIWLGIFILVMLVL